jgi:hypothetical protein
MRVYAMPPVRLGRRPDARSPAGQELCGFVRCDDGQYLQRLRVIHFPTTFRGGEVYRPTTARRHGLASVALHEGAAADAGSVMTMLTVSLLATWLAVNVPEAALPFVTSR